MSKLYNKYKIEKTDGSQVDPQAQYFVLRIDKDPIARRALHTYIWYIEDVDPEFADELRRWAKMYE